MNSYYCIDEFDDFEDISYSGKSSVLIVHKLVKGKCGWCGDIKREIENEIWNKNPDFFQNVNSTSNGRHQHDRHSGRKITTCVEHAVSSVMED